MSTYKIVASLLVVLSLTAAIHCANASELAVPSEVTAKVLQAKANEPGTQPALISIITREALDNLSEGEQRIAYGWMTPGGKNVQIDETIIAVAQFYDREGRAPKDFSEVLEYYVSRRGMDPASLSSADLLEEYPRALNPITGQLYSGFDNPEWSPGGIYIEMIPAEQLEKENAARRGDKPLEWRAHYKIFGEKPGTVLWEDSVGQSITEYGIKVNGREIRVQGMTGEEFERFTKWFIEDSKNNSKQ